MLGPQRHSLLNDQVLHREYSAQAVMDRILDRLVDAFDFKIEDKAQALTSQCVSMPTTSGDAYASFKEVARSKWTLEKRSWSFQEKKQTMIAVMNEKLCSWLLDTQTTLSKNRQSEMADDLILYGNDNDDEEQPLECGYAIMTC